MSIQEIMDTLANATHLKKKSNKTELWPLLVQDVFDNDTVPQSTKEALYRYFLPTKTKTVEDTFRWVHQATSNDETRFYLSAVYCDDGKLIATDGHRMHLWDSPGAGFEQDNFYNINGDKVKMEHANFPPYERVIPSKRFEVEVEDIDKVGVSHIHQKDGKVTTAYNLIPEWDALAFNKEYVDQALNGQKQFKLYYAEQDSSGPILLELNHDRQAVIMPVGRN